MIRAVKAWMPAIIALAAGPLLAEGAWETGGHLKYQGSFFSGEHDGLAHLMDVRVKESYDTSSFTLDLHEQILGASVSRAFGFQSSGILPRDTLRPLRLTAIAQQSETSEIEGRMDRLSARYKYESNSFTIGRQAYSVGNGLTFSVLDVLNPFPPLAIDKDYKVGDDLAVISLDMYEAGRTDLVVSPRRDFVSHEIEEDDSTAAVYQRVRLEESKVDAALLASSHRGAGLFGAGLSKDVSGATARGDAAVSDGRVSFLVNMDRGFGCAGRNCYGFIEYFHSGFGTGRGGYALANPARDIRLAAGELYTLGKNYGSAGSRVELTPLLQLNGAAVFNLDDGSSVLQGRLIWDVLQDVVFQLGVTQPIGEEGDEFGRKTPGAIRSSPVRATEIFLRAEYYF